MAGWGRGVIGVALALAVIACDDTASDGANAELDMTFRLRDASVLDIDRGQREPDQPVGGQGGAGGGAGGGEGGAGGAGGGIIRPPAGCTDGTTRGCLGECGTQTCVEGQWGACATGVETCNGVDDDCDGDTDETWPELGNGCSVDQGACTARGVLACNAAGNGLRCDAADVAAAAEVCNGLDDDCDELVDEDFPGRACCSEDFHCPPGESCNGGECTGGVGPGPGPGPGEPSGCAAPIPMPGFGQYPGDNTLGENAGGGSCGGALGGEVVYSFTLGETRRVQLDTLDSFTDTAIYVRTNCADLFSEVACNDDNALGPAAMTTFEAQANVTYFVFVDSFLLGGPFTLNFGPDAGGAVPECADDFDCNFDEICQGGQCVPDGLGPECFDAADCAAGEICDAGLCVPAPAPACAVDADCPAGETCDAGRCARPLVGGACEAAIDMPDFGRFQADTTDHANEHVTTCQARASGGEAVFTFQLPEASRVTLSTAESRFDTVLSVRSECASMDTELACNDDGAGIQSQLTFAAEAGVRYYAIVDGYSGQGGPVVLDYSADVLPPGCPCGAGLVCVNEACYPDFPEACSGAFPGEGFGPYGGNTELGQNRHQPSCSGGNTAPESMMAFAVDVPRRISVSTAGSEFDTVLYIMSDCGNEIACDDDGGPGLTSSLSFDAVPGQLYYVVVDGYEDAAGLFELTIE